MLSNTKECKEGTSLEKWQFLSNKDIRASKTTCSSTFFDFLEMNLLMIETLRIFEYNDVLKVTMNGNEFAMSNDRDRTNDFITKNLSSMKNLYDFAHIKRQNASEFFDFLETNLLSIRTLRIYEYIDALEVTVNGDKCVLDINRDRTKDFIAKNLSSMKNLYDFAHINSGNKYPHSEKYIVENIYDKYSYPLFYKKN